jgi:hypothetical protein
LEKHATLSAKTRSRIDAGTEGLLKTYKAFGKEALIQQKKSF